MNEREEQKKMWQSQGVKLSRPSIINSAPRNKIEEVMRNLPPLTKTAPVEPVSARPTISNAQESKRTWRFFVICILLIFGIPTFVYGALLIYRHIRTAAVQSNASLVSDVGKDMQLPQGETPTIMTVTDLTPLAGQAFFKDAAIGDKVLIFATSSEAVLYRPSTKKVIVVAPINSNPAPPTQ
jgi:hypothetical protein